jgi:hypothetical protein
LVSFETVYSLLYQRCIFLFLVCIINVLFGGTKRVKKQSTRLKLEIARSPSFGEKVYKYVTLSFHGVMLGCKKT